MSETIKQKTWKKVDGKWKVVPIDLVVTKRAVRTGDAPPLKEHPKATQKPSGENTGGDKGSGTTGGKA